MGKLYTIQSGDVLSQIALDNNTSEDEIMKHNPKIINRHEIKADDVIVLPTMEDNRLPSGTLIGRRIDWTPPAGSTSSPTNSTTYGGTPAKTHIVNTEKDHLDSLWKIAVHYGVDFDQLKKSNPHIKNRKDYHYIINGDVIYLPYHEKESTSSPIISDPVTKCPEYISSNAVPSLYFAIYYQVEDNAFKRAAMTWKNAIDLASTDFFIDKQVKTENNFLEAWNSIYTFANNFKCDVKEGRLYVHSSKDEESENQGLEFYKSTMQRNEIMMLKKLPWGKEGKLWIHSCNSGLERDGWSPAQSFADRQGAITYGTMGFAYFSKKLNYYHGLADRHPYYDFPVYLRAYYRGKNHNYLSLNPLYRLTHNCLIPEREFTPTP